METYIYRNKEITKSISFSSFFNQPSFANDMVRRLFIWLDLYRNHIDHMAMKISDNFDLDQKFHIFHVVSQLSFTRAA